MLIIYGKCPFVHTKHPKKDNSLKSTSVGCFIILSYSSKQSSLKFPAWVPLFGNGFSCLFSKYNPPSPNTRSKWPVYCVVGLFVTLHFCPTQLQFLSVLFVPMCNRKLGQRFRIFLFTHKSSLVINSFNTLKFIFFSLSAKEDTTCFCFPGKFQTT